MIEKGPPGGGQFDAVHATAHQLNTNLIFEIADLTTEGRLRRVQLFLGRDRQASGLGNRNEIAKVPQLYRLPSISSRHGAQLTKSFSQALAAPTYAQQASRREICGAY
jgi:hypothetical protein